VGRNPTLKRIGFPVALADFIQLAISFLLNPVSSFIAFR
jgi:hypothetical protein